MRNSSMLLVAAAGLVLVLTSCTGSLQSSATAPTAAPTQADVPIKAKFQLVEGPSFSQDIQPIFNEFCVKCHGAERVEANLRLDSYDSIMRGTAYGPIIVPSAPDRSTVVYVIEHPQSRELAMPKDTHKISPNRIANIRYWIESGAKNN